MFIAGWKTNTDWIATRAVLRIGEDAAMWEDVTKEYFHERLFRRYMEPIACLQQNGTFSGEGFSITTIQCALIEFLESTVQGVSYRYLRRGERLQQYEYSQSREIFTHFLTRRDPFRSFFSEELAEMFYSGVRCALLHEARTKYGWKIHAKGSNGQLIDPDNKTVYRDDFQAALMSFVHCYEKQLCREPLLQAAFIRKFDSLASDV